MKRSLTKLLEEEGYKSAIVLDDSEVEDTKEKEANQKNSKKSYQRLNPFQKAAQGVQALKDEKQNKLQVFNY